MAVRRDVLVVIESMKCNFFGCPLCNFFYVVFSFLSTTSFTILDSFYTISFRLHLPHIFRWAFQRVFRCVSFRSHFHYQRLFAIGMLKTYMLWLILQLVYITRKNERRIYVDKYRHY